MVTVRYSRHLYVKIRHKEIYFPFFHLSFYILWCFFSFNTEFLSFSYDTLMPTICLNVQICCLSNGK